MHILIESDASTSRSEIKQAIKALFKFHIIFKKDVQGQPRRNSKKR
jgi:hypothetical protein